METKVKSHHCDLLQTLRRNEDNMSTPLTLVSVFHYPVLRRFPDQIKEIPGSNGSDTQVKYTYTHIQTCETTP